MIANGKLSNSKNKGEVTSYFTSERIHRGGCKSLGRATNEEKMAWFANVENEVDGRSSVSESGLICRE